MKLTISPLGGSVINYTLQWRALGATIWNTNNVAPANPITASILNSTVTLPAINTVYQFQLLTNCGTSVAQSTIITKSNRGCPAVTELGLTTTDTTISGAFPLPTPNPVNIHFASLKIYLLLGTQIVDTKTISSIGASNQFLFTGLTASTNYSITVEMQFSQADSFSDTSLATGDTTVLHNCSNYTIATQQAQVCPTVTIISITQS